jgi:RNA polymerase sigma factor for flagellar operon FliA
VTAIQIDADRSAATPAALKSRVVMSEVVMAEAVVSEALILENSHLVERTARYLLRRMPGTVELDDLVQAGMVGLLEAAERYTSRKGASFATFAAHRIRGAMLDSLRDADWGPRSLRRRLRDIEAAQRRVELDTCDAPRPRAIAAALGVTLDAYHRTLRDSNLAVLMSLDEPAGDAGARHLEPVDENPPPDEALEHEEALRAVMAGLSALPEFDHTILSLYYEKEYLLREIATILGLTESRVCQIHKKIIERLRVATRGNLNRLMPAAAFSRRPDRSRALSARVASG